MIKSYVCFARIDGNDMVMQDTDEEGKARIGSYHFNSVQGSKGEEGELFGIENLLQLSRKSILNGLRQACGDEEADQELLQEGQLVDTNLLLEEMETVVRKGKKSKVDMEAPAHRLLAMLGVDDQKFRSDVGTPTNDIPIKEEDSEKKCHRRKKKEYDDEEDEEFTAETKKGEGIAAIKREPIGLYVPLYMKRK